MQHNKKILTFSLLTISSFSAFFFFSNNLITNTDNNEQEIKLNSQEIKLLKNHRSYFIKKVNMIGTNYIVDNLDFFEHKLEYKVEMYDNLITSEENQYYPIINGYSGNDDLVIVLGTNDENFDPESLKITYDYNIYNGKTINDVDGNINYLYPISIGDQNYFYTYEVDDLIPNGTDYYDFNFYADDYDNLIYSSKSVNDFHYLTPFENNILGTDITNVSINWEKTDFPTTTIDIETPPFNPNIENLNPLQASGIRIYYETYNDEEIILPWYIYSRHIDLNYIYWSRYTLSYEIYNLLPGEYENAGLAITNAFDYNYYDDEFYPVFGDFQVTKTKDISIQYDNIEQNTKIRRAYFRPSRKNLNKNQINLYIKYTSDATEYDYDHLYLEYYEESSLLEKPMLKRTNALSPTKQYKNGYCKYEITFKNNIEYSDVNFYLGDNEKSSYYYDFQFLNDFNREGKITNVEVINKEEDKITFNVSFKNTPTLEAQNIQMIYYDDGEKVYSEDVNNLILKKEIENSERNENTYQFELNHLNNEHTYSGFEIFLPQNVMQENNIKKSRYDNSFEYNYSENNFSKDAEIRLPEKHLLYLLFIFPAFFLICLGFYLHHKISEKIKLKNMDKFEK